MATMRRDRGHAQDSDRNPSWSVLQITLPAFVVRILQRRAQNRELSVSAVVEESILDGIMLDEVQRMAELSPDFARVAKTWIRSEVAKGKRADHV